MQQGRQVSCSWQFDPLFMSMTKVWNKQDRLRQVLRTMHRNIKFSIVEIVLQISSNAKTLVMSLNCLSHLHYTKKNCVKLQIPHSSMAVQKREKKGTDHDYDGYFFFVVKHSHPFVKQMFFSQMCFKCAIFLNSLRMYIL